MASNSVEVYVKLPTGRNTKYDAGSHEKLQNICDKIASEEKIAPNQVRLKYQGKVLDPSKTVGEYGVREETILKSEFLVPRAIAIAVIKEGTDESEELTISNLDPISALYHRVADILDFSLDTLQLTLEDRPIASSSKSLLDSGIASGSTVVACKKEPKTKLNKGKNSSVEETMDETKRQNVLSSFNAGGKPVEVAFSFDTTGSMYSYLTQIRQKLRDTCTRLIQDIPNIRISLIAQGDYCDSQSTYAIRYQDLTSDVQRLVDFAQVPATSGGDSPECYELVLKKVQELDWSEDSAKALVVIGDLYPHPPSYTDQKINWHQELELLKGMDIKVYGVQAGHNHDATLFYEELADVSGGCYLSLQHLDVITDMFLAVCYNEGEEDMLENFQQELLEAGKLTSVKQEIFTKLKDNQDKKNKDAQNAKPKKNKRYSSAPWWDINNDTGRSPSYYYHEETDNWLTYPKWGSQVVTAPSPAPIVVTTDRASTRRRRIRDKARRCSIM